MNSSKKINSSKITVPSHIVNSNITQNKLSSTTSNFFSGSKIARLQETGNFFAIKIKNEKEKIEKLKQELGSNQKVLDLKREELLELKKKKENKGNNPVLLNSKIKQMEKKLENLMQRHNEILAENKMLRDQIDDIRREKNIFNNIQYSLTEELQYKTQLKMKVQEESIKTKDEISWAKKNLKAARDKAFQEQKEFEREYNSIFQMLEKESQIENKINIKNPYENNSIEPNFIDGNIGNPYLTQNEESFSNNNSSKKKNFNENNYNLEEIQKEVEQYEAIFEHLKKETGKEDINEMIDIFVEYEEKNYSLFNYINVLNNELENLEKIKKNLEDEIENILRPQENHNDPKFIKINNLRKEIEECNVKKEKYDEKQKELSNVIESLKQGVPSLLKKLEINLEEFEDKGMILSENDINESNLLQFLGLIEERANSILQNYEFAFPEAILPNQKRPNLIDESLISKSKDSEYYKDMEKEMNKPIYDLTSNLAEEKLLMGNRILDAKEKNFLDKKDFEKFALNEIEKLEKKKVKSVNKF